MAKDWRSSVFHYRQFDLPKRKVALEGCSRINLLAKIYATESARVSGLMLAFNKQINAATVDPQFIVNVRKKLRIDQRQAAEIFGGGANAFSRYENGKTKPPLALVKLLKVLDRHLDLLDEVKAG